MLSISTKWRVVKNMVFPCWCAKTNIFQLSSSSGLLIYSIAPHLRTRWTGKATSHIYVLIFVYTRFCAELAYQYVNLEFNIHFTMQMYKWQVNSCVKSLIPRSVPQIAYCMHLRSACHLGLPVNIHWDPSNLRVPNVPLSRVGVDHAWCRAFY